MHRVVQMLRRIHGDDFLVVIKGVGAPEFIGHALGIELLDIGAFQQAIHANNHIAKAPKTAAALLVHHNRQARHYAGAALHQIHRAGQGHLAGIACAQGLFILGGIRQLVKTDGFFIALQRVHLGDHPIGREANVRHAVVVGQHVARYGFKGGGLPLAQTHQCRHGVIQGKGLAQAIAQ